MKLRKFVLKLLLGLNMIFMTGGSVYAYDLDCPKLPPINHNFKFVNVELTPMQIMRTSRQAIKTNKQSIKKTRPIAKPNVCLTAPDRQVTLGHVVGKQIFSCKKTLTNQKYYTIVNYVIK